jgi:hypothetical protein
MDTEIWRGDVDGFTVRIRWLAVNDCVVEKLVNLDKPIKWEPADDELASHTYMLAFLSTLQA